VSGIVVRIVDAPEAARRIEEFVEVLMDAVVGGGSISFMDTISADEARGFWRGVFSDVESGGRILIVAETNGRIDGTVQTVFADKPNQPHRGDVAKMLVHRRARRLGLGAALMQAAEAAAREAGKTLLVLDTVTGGDAERLYARLGWQRCGEIPGYALFPRGGLCSTTVFYRVLAQ
jgi:GNAT superfamily N-acetyltransferase